MSTPPPMERIESKMSTTSQASNLSTSNLKKRIPTDFEFGKLLGEGSFSSVYLATEKSTGLSYAVKVLDKHHIVKERKTKYVKIEKDVLNRLNHPFCVKLYFTFQDSISLYFVLEYCQNKDILDLLKSNGRFDRVAALFYIAEIVEAVKYIHSCKVLHRDLKPENILLDQNNHIKVTDFGSAKIANEAPDVTDLARKHSFVGTAEYCSPELLDHKGTTYASDIWAIGCIFFQFLVGIPPFKGGSDYLTFQKILKLDYKIPAEVDNDFRILIEKILVLDVYARISLKDIMGSEIFKEVLFENLHEMIPPKLLYLTPLAEYKHQFEPDDEDIPMPSPIKGGESPSGSPAVRIGNSAESIDDEINSPLRPRVGNFPSWLPANEDFIKFGEMRKVIKFK